MVYCKKKIMLKKFNFLVIAIGLHQAVSFLIPITLLIFSGRHEGEIGLAITSYFLAVITPIAIFTSVPNRNFLLVNKNYSIRQILIIRFIGLLVLFTPLFLFGYIKNSPWIPFLFFLLKSSELLLDVPIANYINIRAVSKLVILFLYRLTLLLASFLLAEYLDNLLIYVYFQIVGQVILAALLSKRGAEPIKFPELVSSLVLSLAGFFVSIESSIPRYVFGYLDGFKELAAYAACSAIITAVATFTNLLTQLSLNKTAENFQNNNIKAIKKDYLFIGALSVILCLFVFLALTFSFFGDKYYSLFGLQYSSYYQSIVILSGFIAICNIIKSLGAALALADKKYKATLVSSMFFSIFGLITCLMVYRLLGPHFTLALFGILSIIHGLYYFFLVKR
jgi:O-antigen/teichoic acid export membrane protein